VSTRPGSWVVIAAVISRLSLEGIAVAIDGENLDEVLAAAERLLDVLGVEPAPEGNTQWG
jgi:hypothetical protein